jgi:hypothetical protein
MRKILLKKFFKQSPAYDWESQEFLNVGLDIVEKDSDHDIFKDILNCAEELKKELSNLIDD